MAPRIAAAAAVALIALAACSYEEAGNQDFVNFEVDPIAVTPSAVQPPEPVVLSSLHTPVVAPLAMSQKPVQQSVERLHASPG